MHLTNEQKYVCSSQASFPSFLSFSNVCYFQTFFFLFSFVLQVSVDQFGDNDISMRLQLL